MRIGRRCRPLLGALVFAGLGVASPDLADARPRWTWVQGDLSVGAQHHRDDGRPDTPDAFGVGAAYIGFAIPTDPWMRTFAGSGIEGTVDGANGPYQWSIGAGTRMGLVWRFPRGGAGPFPDLYVYSRITPFLGMRNISDDEYLAGERELTKRGVGVRAGLGFTAPGWSAMTLPAMLSGAHGMHIHDEYSLLCCLGLFGLALLNHGEVTYEVYRESGMPTVNRVGWRIGIGF